MRSMKRGTWNVEYEMHFCYFRHLPSSNYMTELNWMRARYVLSFHCGNCENCGISMFHCSKAREIASVLFSNDVIRGLVLLHFNTIYNSLCYVYSSSSCFFSLSFSFLQHSFLSDHYKCCMPLWCVLQCSMLNAQCSLYYLNIDQCTHEPSSILVCKLHFFPFFSFYFYIFFLFWFICYISHPIQFTKAKYPHPHPIESIYIKHTAHSMFLGMF